MALLTQQLIDPAGTTVTFAAATSGGDTFKPVSDRAKLLVKNDSGGSINVTLTTFKTVTGLTVPNRVVAVAAGVIKAIPLLKELYADPADGLIDIAYSAVTSVTVAIITD